MKFEPKVIGHVLKEHLPEILTVTAVGLIPLGDYFLVKGTKEENKKKQIAGGVLHVVSGVCIVASNRVSNTQKLSLVAASAATASEYSKYKEKVKENVSPEEYEKIQKAVDADDLDQLDLDNLNEVEGEKKIFYFPQLRTKEWDGLLTVTDGDITCAFINLNDSYTFYGWASVGELLKFIDPEWYNNVFRKEHPEVSAYFDDIGWEVYDEDPESGWTNIMINEYVRKASNGQDVTFIRFEDGQEPRPFYSWQDYYEHQFDMLEDQMSAQKEMDSEFQYAVNKKDKEEEPFDRN